MREEKQEANGDDLPRIQENKSERWKGDEKSGGI